MSRTPPFRLIGLAFAAGLLLSVPSAEAARIPTAEERAALERLLEAEVGDTCDGWFKRTRPLPLVTDDGTWGTATTLCQHSRIPSGAGTIVWTVWAHRSGATSADWTMVRPSGASRIPPCLDENGLFNTVPEPVVRELREGCVNPSASRGYEPLGVRSLQIYRNRLRRYADAGPEISLESLSDEPGSGDFTISHYDRHAPPLNALRRAFGAPRRSGCEARWPRYGLTARACRGRVTKLSIVDASWRLATDAEPTENVTGPQVLIGDPVPLARYLDTRLAKLRANGRLRLPYMRIGRSLVSVFVVTREDRITAIEIVIR